MTFPWPVLSLDGVRWPCPLCLLNSLTKSVQLEKMFLKFKEDKNFSNIFQYVEQMAKVAKHLRISGRSVVLAMGELR